MIIDILPLCIEDLIRREEEAGREFTFCQIGAHDGVHFDPIHKFVNEQLWRGIMVEPQPAVFERLKLNYQSRANLTFINAAVAHTDGPVTLHTFNDPTLPDHATMLASFLPQAITNNGHGYVGQQETITVPGITLNTLFKRLDYLSLLQIDTEGFDYDILCMLSQQPIRPTLLHFEAAFMNGEQRAHTDVLLAQMGYRWLNVGIDTVAYRQDDEDFENRQRNQGYEL